MFKKFNVIIFGLLMIAMIMTACQPTVSEPADLPEEVVSPIEEVAPPTDEVVVEEEPEPVVVEEPAEVLEPITLTLTSSVIVEEPHKQALDALKAAYEDQNPYVTIEITGAPYAEFWDKLTTEIVAGTEACIVQLQSGNAFYAQYASLREGETGAFVNLDPYIKGTDLEDLADQRTLTHNGHYIGLSNYAWGIHAIYYRPSLLEEAGIDPESIQTWEDLQEAAITLTKPATADTPPQYGFGILVGPAPLALSEWEAAVARPVGQGLFFKNEAEPYTAENVVINSEPIVWAAQFWQDLIHTHQVTSVGHQTKGDVRQQFWAGQVAMTIEGPWFTGMTRAAAPDVLENDLDVIPLPKVVYDGNEYIYHADTSGITHLISSNCAYPEEAWKFLEWMATPEGQNLVALSGMIPSNFDYSLSQDYIASSPINAKIASFLDVYSPRMARPNIPESGEMVAIARDAVSEMFVAGSDVRQALDIAAERIKSIFE